LKIQFTAAIIIIAVLLVSTGFLYQSNAGLEQQLKSQQSVTALVQPLALAMSHWNDIAIENATAIASQYGTDSVLHWVGGPLTGTYQGQGQIQQVWAKFSKLYEAVFWYAVQPPTVSPSQSGTTVTAALQFVVSPTTDPIHTYILNVTEQLSYQQAGGGYQLGNEVWKVSPLDLSAAISGFPTSKSLQTDMVLAQAYAHWNAIGIENSTLITSEYASDAQLSWRGGPLTGNYTGRSAINATWTKFSNAYEYVVWYAVSPPTVTLSGTSAIVKAPLQFVVFPFPTSASPSPKSFVLNVNETLTYTYSTSNAAWMLSAEIWQVAPLQISAVAPGYTPSTYTG
jgi:hypothetical protein